MSTFEPFGELNSQTNESQYAYANIISMGLLQKLNDVEGFEHVKQSDIINAGLVFLNLFFNIHIDEEYNENIEDIVQDLTFDEKEFKDFLTISINHCKMNNMVFNDCACPEGEKNGI